jgi:hypothetical protein
MLLYLENGLTRYLLVVFTVEHAVNLIRMFVAQPLSIKNE